ncbi:hypothetical protein [Streptomyces aureus]|uniref:hypothetical protein n=1 Tax=Streptomyces aureus TaxID=193461 RepID=UPI0036B62CE5
MSGGARCGETAKPVADDDEDLQDVLADQLHHERNDPGIHEDDELLHVALADPPVAVS